jgi:hypothetical protein
MGSAPRPLLHNGSIKTFQQPILCFLRGPCKGVILIQTAYSHSESDSDSEVQDNERDSDGSMRTESGVQKSTGGRRVRTESVI